MNCEITLVTVIRTTARNSLFWKLDESQLNYIKTFQQRSFPHSGSRRLCYTQANIRHNTWLSKINNWRLYIYTSIHTHTHTHTHFLLKLYRWASYHQIYPQILFIRVPSYDVPYDVLFVVFQRVKKGKLVY